MHEEKLQKLGLTNGEARVYLALVELGSSKVGPVVKKSKVSYSKIYDVLERLTEKGLSSYTIKEKTKYFQAVDPSRLQEYLEKKEKELQENKKVLDDLVPYLTKISSSGDDHGAEIFLGNKGIMTAYDILLKNTPKNGNIRFFYANDPKYSKQILEFYFRTGVFFRKIESNFKKNNVKWKGILRGKKSNSQIPSFMKQHHVSFPIPGNIDIGGDNVLIIAWSKQPIGILIKSAEIAENFSNYFDSIWSVLEESS